MRKRGFSIYSDNSGNGEVSKKGPLGTLATSWAAGAATRKPLATTDVNISSIFGNASRKVVSKNASKVNSDGSITAMQSVLETAKKVPSYGATRSAGAATRAVARDLSRSGDLQQTVVSSVARLNSRVRVASRDEFDQLVAFQKLVMLSEHELLVVVDESRSLVLHSKSALSAQRVDRFALMKLALNSQCYYVLYNDVYWYMRWKFF